MIQRRNWPLNAGRIRRPVPIRCMWLYGLDAPPACYMSLLRILALPGVWPIILAGLRQTPVIWTDQVGAAGPKVSLWPSPSPLGDIPYIRNGELGYMGPDGEWVPDDA